jgi:peptidyl-tRNA hydrolase
MHNKPLVVSDLLSICKNFSSLREMASHRSLKHVLQMFTNSLQRIKLGVSGPTLRMKVTHILTS